MHFLILALLLAAPGAQAHVAQAPDTLPGWGAEPWVLALLALSAMLYAAGGMRLWLAARGWYARPAPSPLAG
jgi:hypothetical protein